MADHTDSLTVHGEHGTTIFTLSGPTLVVHRASDSEFHSPPVRVSPHGGPTEKWPRIETTVRHVLWAEVKENLFEIALVARRKNSHPLSLVLVAGTVKSDQLEIATAFTTSLMDVAYAGIRRQRRLRVLVNPKSGPGNGIGLYHRKVEPIFRAAHCHVELTLTTHHGHAYELMKTLDLGQYDAIVVVSGDGLVHEIINGFAEHARPEEAFRLPITPVAGGSGNALALNILGPKEGCDICAAALNAVKGRPMRIDLCSVTQGEKKTLSFISQCVGMLADVDLGTEHLRFLGSNRFVLGYVYGGDIFS
ncbi:uncharacterized protein FIBRA_04481 [Fibroporia radiculosa]|uniref:DAGKc domain-containing protein n=1 Tax=Fibroporia radiculosa TaxID=599839 RepID=J4GPC2_9APHY|nr:uncharacterized protein FIBRA_04481 [Fibroporia radiculosa]CCM02385.1 predicted protein [Fibroporia radiculosa]